MNTGPYVKILRLDMIHNGFQYKKGLNIDTVKFNPSGHCLPGGLYFCEAADLHLYIGFGELIGDVKIPKDAKVHRESRKLKADKIIITNIRLLTSHQCWNDMIFCRNALKEYGLALTYVIRKTTDLCMIAVTNNGHALQYVPIQTYDICLSAVMNNGRALEYVKNKTYELCMIAVTQCGYALRFVDIKHPDICKKAVENDGLAIYYVDVQTDELCKIAVMNNGLALEYVINKTPEICKIAIRQNAKASLFIESN